MSDSNGQADADRRAQLEAAINAQFNRASRLLLVVGVLSGAGLALAIAAILNESNIEIPFWANYVLLAAAVLYLAWWSRSDLREKLRSLHSNELEVLIMLASWVVAVVIALLVRS